MSAIINFYKSYPADAILITAIAIVLIVLFIIGKKDALKKAALYGVAVAEEEWKKSKYGLIKKAQVITYLRVQFPVVTSFLSDKILGGVVQRAFEIASEVWKKAKEALEEE